MVLMSDFFIGQKKPSVRMDLENNKNEGNKHVDNYDKTK